MPDPKTPGSVFEMAELGALFDAHGRRLTAIVRRRLDAAAGGRMDPDGIVADAFADAARGWAAYRAARTPDPFVWLYRLAIDRLIDEWRKNVRPKRDMRRDVPWPSHPSVDFGLRADQTGVSEAAVRNEQAALLRAAIDRLKAADREVVLLRGYDDLSFREIGQLLGVGENTATVRYVRALKRLKQEWQHLTGESRP